MDTNKSPVDETLDIVSDGTSSASEGSVDIKPRASVRRQPSKKRKSTYYQRKDEIEVLQEQVQLLQDELAKQKEASRIANLAIMDTNREGMLQDAINIERNNLRLAGTQSMISAYNESRGEGSVPLNTYIHLPHHQEARNAILSSMRDARLDSGVRYLIERTKFLDLRKRHHHRESFEQPNGDLISTGLEVAVFDQGHTLQQISDEFMYFITHLEISISEQLGILTIRESEQIGQYNQARFLSSLPEGLEIEWNAAMFARYTPATGGTPGYAIATINPVTQDDKYPYRPDSCGRLEMSGATLLSEISTANGTVIIMTTWEYSRFSAPNYTVPKECVDSIQRLMEWCRLMPKAISERLALLPPGNNIPASDPCMGPDDVHTL